MSPRNAATGPLPRSGLHKACVLLAGILAAGAASIGHAQQPAARLEVTATRIEGRTLTVSVAVLDAANNPVVGQTAADFRAQIDATAAPISSVTTGTNAALPLGLVFAVDTSGSMAGGAIASARQALLPLVTALQPGDQATLLTFAQAVSTVVPVTNDQAALTAGLQSMQASGNTALYAGTARAVSAAAALTQPRKAIVLLSDGEDFGNASGAVTRDQALEAARTSGVPFFVVGLGLEIDQQFLTSLGRENGGQYFAAASPAELAQLYSRISERLRQQYTIALELPASLSSGEHRLSLTSGTATGSAAFTLTSPALAPGPSLKGLPAELREATTVQVVDVPAGAVVRFEVDGREMKAGADGKSVLLGPYAFEPSAGHLLVASVGSGPPLEQRFSVAQLPPRLVSPSSLPNLSPGDLIRLTIQSQPGAGSVTYFVDGREIERDDTAPFEFVLPQGDYSSGRHTLRVELSNGSETGTVEYPFEGEQARERNVAAYLLFGLLALGAAAGLGYGAKRALAAVRQRPRDPGQVTDVRELEQWVQSGTREGIRRRADAPLPVGEVAPTRWAQLSVLEGPDVGKRFFLTAETELVGRGKAASVRLTDRQLLEEHFLISADGFLTASTPSAAISVDGVSVRRTELRQGARIAAGTSVLEFLREP